MRTKTPQQADKMLAAAARLFGTQRFHEVRMEDIAAEAAVGKGTLYRYFQDKEELYAALLERASRQITERLRDELSRAAGARHRLRTIVATVMAYFDEQPHLFDLIQRAEVLQGPGFPWQQARDEIGRLVRDVFQEGKDRGEFTVGDPELAALMLLGGMRSVYRFGTTPRPGELADRIVAGVLEGFANRQPV